MIQCLQALSDTLKKDLCNLKMSDVLLGESEGIDRDFPAHIRYACFYWVDHLCQAGDIPDGLRDDGELQVFLKEHFLHWLEALNLMNMISHGVVLEALLKVGSRWSYGQSLL